MDSLMSERSKGKSINAFLALGLNRNNTVEVIEMSETGAKG